jgi:hypothetical protein
MADRIFPNRYQVDPLDSDLVFQGIDWDTFNQRLAAAESGEDKRVPTELLKALNNAHPGAFDEVANSNDRESGSMYAEEDMEDDEMSEDEAMMVDSYKTAKKKKGLDPESGLGKYLAEQKKMKENKSKNSDEEDHDEEDHDEVDSKEDMKRKGPKKNEKVKKAYVFNHPSQLSAEAVEAAEAAGDEHLKSAILAARHDRRVRLASQIETRIASDKDKSIKLAQRKAYREALVQRVAEKMEDDKEASMGKTCDSCGEKYAGKECNCGHASSKEMKEAKAFSSAAKKAFAAKALAEGFPIEYINARLGETSAPAVDKLSNIKNVLASGLEANVKVAAASSMIKTATLSDADYSRLVDYWKNELGYGDQDWIDALFTKKYDKKN